MPVGWFIAPFKRRPLSQGPPGAKAVRYCAIDDFTDQVVADGGIWAASECLGHGAVVKVRASAATLTAISKASGVLSVPGATLDSPLSSLTNANKNAIRNRILSLGYTSAELTAALGNDIGAVTLGQLLRFVASRRRKVRYDAATDSVIDDGPVQPTVPVDAIDLAV